MSYPFNKSPSSILWKFGDRCVSSAALLSFSSPWNIGINKLPSFRSVSVNSFHVLSTSKMSLSIVSLQVSLHHLLLWPEWHHWHAAQGCHLLYILNTYPNNSYLLFLTSSLMFFIPALRALSAFVTLCPHRILRMLLKQHPSNPWSYFRTLHLIFMCLKPKSTTEETFDQHLFYFGVLVIRCSFSYIV